MKEDPIAPGVPPLALHCIDVPKKVDFLPHLANQYSYEVLGGLHTVTARKELLKEIPGIDFHLDMYISRRQEKYTIVYVRIYGIDIA